MNSVLFLDQLMVSCSRVHVSVQCEDFSMVYGSPSTASSAASSDGGQVTEGSGEQVSCRECVGAT